MSQLSSKTFLTPKTYKTTQRTNVTRSISSNVPNKSSLLRRARQSWLTILIGIIAFVAVVAAIVMAIVSFVILRSTTVSSSTVTTTTVKSSIITTNVARCFTIPSPRPSNVWLNVGAMAFTRLYHTSTLISQDNSVLIVGGLSIGAISSVQKYIPSTGCFQTMRNMPRVRYHHTADQLPSLSGYVLIAGGYGVGGALEFADLYHPITGDVLTMHLTTPRYRHVSAIIGSSQLVLIGGQTTGAVIADSSDTINTASNASFVAGSNIMSEPRVYHAGAVLGNNSNVVLITGGYNGGYLGTAVLYYGSSNSFVSLGGAITMTPTRGYHTMTYLPSPIHKILIVGGNTGASGTLVLFDIASLTFTTLTNNLITPRYDHTATLLSNGKVLVAGGYNAGAIQTCELIDPSNNYTVTAARSLNANRYYHTATLINDGTNDTVLVCGGCNTLGAPLSSCELYLV